VERRITISAGRGNTAFRSANSPGVTTFFDKGPSINQTRVKEIRVRFVQSRARHSIPSIRNDGISSRLVKVHARYSRNILTDDR